MFPEVTAANKNVATATDAVLTCTITEITQQVSVTWENSDNDDLSGSTGGTLDQYTVIEGAFNTDKQESTLTITTTELGNLGDSTDFSCIVKSGEYSADSPAIAKILTMTKLTYGMYIL